MFLNRFKNDKQEQIKNKDKVEDAEILNLDNCKDVSMEKIEGTESKFNIFSLVWCMFFDLKTARSKCVLAYKKDGDLIRCLNGIKIDKFSNYGVKKFCKYGYMAFSMSTRYFIDINRLSGCYPYVIYDQIPGSYPLHCAESGTCGRIRGLYSKDDNADIIAEEGVFPNYREIHIGNKTTVMEMPSRINLLCSMDKDIYDRDGEPKIYVSYDFVKNCEKLTNENMYNYNNQKSL